MLLGHPEEVSLRPSANSMMFKQTNINPNLPLNSGKQQAPPLPAPAHPWSSPPNPYDGTLLLRLIGERMVVN